MNVLINGKVVTAMIDGKLLMRSDLSDEQIVELQNLTLSYHSKQDENVKQQILDLLDFSRKLIVEEKKEIIKKVEIVQQKKEEVKHAIDSITKRIIDGNLYPELFVVKEGQLYLKGFESVNLPEPLINKLFQCKENNEDVNSLVNFWKLCLLNPNPEARRDLFKYVSRQNLVVTSKGYIVTYRRIVKTNNVERSPLQVYATPEIIRIKNSKMSLTRYSIGEENGSFFTLDHRTKRYETFTGKMHGTLAELSKEFENSTLETFTDAHTGKFLIQLGKAIKQDRSKCNSNSREECSYGLHVGTPSYVRGSNGLGDTVIVALVNPMHVVSVPYEDAHKMRVCEYYVSALLNNVDEIKLIDEAKIAVYEDDYSNFEIKELDNILSKKVFGEEKIVTDVASEADKLKSEQESLERQEEYLNKKLNELDQSISFSDDFISNQISLKEIRDIIESRRKKK